MTSLTCALLALAVLALPAQVPAVLRAAALADRGRLVPRGRAFVRDGRPRGAGVVVASASLGVGAAATTYWVAGVPLGIAAAVVAGALWLVARDLSRRRAQAGARAQLRAALRVLVGELDVGTGPAAALSAAADVAPRFATALRTAAVAAASGADTAEVLCRQPALEAVGCAWRLGEHTGIALAGVLARVETDLAAADEQRRAVAIALAGPRASAVVLAALPLLGFALGAGMGARPWTFLLGSAAGRLVCSIGVVLDVAGLLWLRAILRRAEAS